MKKEKKTYKASIATPELLAETVYDPVAKSTCYAVFQNGEVTYSDSQTTEHGLVYPLQATGDIVAKGVVLLPSEPIEYGTDEDLLAAIQTHIHKYCDISQEFELIASHYVLLSWLHDRVNELAYLRVRGDYGSGKTRFLRVVGSICYRAITASGATTVSPIFRIMDQVHGTLVLDEADFGHSDEKSDMVKILNTGFQKGTPVLRTEGKGIYEVKSYDTYGPKIIATRQNYDDQALESRFLIEDMGRSKLRPDVPIRLGDGFREETLTLRNRLLMWRFRNYYRPLQFDDKPIEGLPPRMQQIIMPLLAIVPSDQIRDTLIAHARRYAAELVADRGLSWESEVILAILRLHQRTPGLDGLTVKEISGEVNSEMDLGESLSARKVGWILRSKLQLKPERTSRGFVLSLSKNRERLAYWREKLGINDEHLNVVNVAEGEVDYSNAIPF